MKANENWKPDGFQWLNTQGTTLILQLLEGSSCQIE